LVNAAVKTGGAHKKSENLEKERLQSKGQAPTFTAFFGARA
jgi:hypothetical protein